MLLARRTWLPDAACCPGLPEPAAPPCDHRSLALQAMASWCSSIELQLASQGRVTGAPKRRRAGPVHNTFLVTQFSF